MNRRQAILNACLLGGLGSLAGCAAPVRQRTDTVVWHGRLALRVQADASAAAPPGASFSAAFDLSGDAARGELNFYSPLGSTLAAIRWEPGAASVRSRGETRPYDSLDQLIVDTLGADVPVAALFEWLAGQAQPVPGWQVDLSARAQGKITAQRLTTPRAELRVILDN
mgnify:CR=1 FL=1